MGRLKGRRPSSALLVAVVALVAALGGGAVAGVAVTSLNKKEKKQVKTIAKKQGKKQAKKQINKQEPNLNVNSAKTADEASSADEAATANGDRPVRISSVNTEGDSSTVTLFREGGLWIGYGGCVNGFISSTAANGILYLGRGRPDSSYSGSDYPSFDPDAFPPLVVFPDSGVTQTTITFQGADGTVVSGVLMWAGGIGEAADKCSVSGTLFVSEPSQGD
jgi:hypothetical protein